MYVKLKTISLLNVNMIKIGVNVRSNDKLFFDLVLLLVWKIKKIEYISRIKSEKTAVKVTSVPLLNFQIY